MKRILHWLSLIEVQVRCLVLTVLSMGTVLSWSLAPTVRQMYLMPEIHTTNYYNVHVGAETFSHVTAVIDNNRLSIITPQGPRTFYGLWTAEPVETVETQTLRTDAPWWTHPAFRWWALLSNLLLALMAFSPEISLAYHYLRVRYSMRKLFREHLLAVNKRV